MAAHVAGAVVILACLGFVATAGAAHTSRGPARTCDPRPELTGKLRVRGTTCSSARYVICGFYFTERPVRHFVCRGIGTTWCYRPGATIWFSGKLYEC